MRNLSLLIAILLCAGCRAFRFGTAKVADTTAGAAQSFSTFQQISFVCLVPGVICWIAGFHPTTKALGKAAQPLIVIGIVAAAFPWLLDFVGEAVKPWLWGALALGGSYGAFVLFLRGRKKWIHRNNGACDPCKLS